jgi:hypothetical protein
MTFNAYLRASGNSVPVPDKLKSEAATAVDVYYGSGISVDLAATYLRTLLRNLERKLNGSSL